MLTDGKTRWKKETTKAKLLFGRKKQRNVKASRKDEEKNHVDLLFRSRIKLESPQL